MTARELISKVLFKEIGQGLRQTFRHMFHKPVTFQYPREKRMIPDAHRGALGLLRYEDGSERCVGCDLCEAACPSHCIKVVSGEQRTPEGTLIRWAPEFYIDMTKCVFCGFCVEACPVNALGMTKFYEYSTHDKRTLIFDKKRLYEIGDQHYKEAKGYLVAHHQEEADEESREYRYRFPSYVK